jgi:thiamine pyridinylase
MRPRTAFCLLLLVQVSPLIAQDGVGVRRKLSVALYPYIPERADLYWKVEQEFEDKYPAIDLRFVDTAAGYYKSEPANVLKGAKADVVEVDTVLLYDLVAQKLIEPLSDDRLPTATFLPVAESAARLDGKVYGVPHWVCGNFLFFRKDDPERGRFEKLRSLADLERVLGRPLSEHQSLLVDLRGKSTLGEKFLDAMLDTYGTPEAVLKKLDAKTPDAEALKSLDRLFALCPGGLCDSDKHHEFSPFYAHQFAERKARAFVGYSERLFFVIDHYLNGIREDQPAVGKFGWDETGDPAGTDDIGVVPATLGDKASRTLTWVDILSLRAGMDDQKKKDALAFIDFFNSEAFMLASLLPEYGHAPRYLLPARSATFSNKKLTTAAPLYPRFYEIMKDGVTMTAPDLNGKLRSVGKVIEERGFPGSP